jgi:protein TonB
MVIISRNLLLIILFLMLINICFGINGKSNETFSTPEENKPFDFISYEDPPESINPFPPQYPDFAIRTGVEGTVILEVNVYKDSTVGNIRVLKSLMAGPGGLDEAAIAAVKQWRFQPGKYGGKPIDTRVVIPIEFSLNKQPKAQKNKTNDSETCSTTALGCKIKNIEYKTIKNPNPEDYDVPFCNWTNSETNEREFNFEIYDISPEVIDSIATVYPESCKRAGIEGIVVLELEIFKDGTIRKIQKRKSALSGPGGLDEAAINAVKQWKFKPGQSKGKNIDTSVLIPIEFKSQTK